MRIGYIPIELVIDYIQEEETTIAIVLIFILGFIGVILLIEVVLWQVGILLSSDPLQIWQICLAASVDIGINVRRLGLSISPLSLILCIEAALDI
jgi:hypothetical protein